MEAIIPPVERETLRHELTKERFVRKTKQWRHTMKSHYLDVIRLLFM